MNAAFIGIGHRERQFVVELVYEKGTYMRFDREAPVVWLVAMAGPTDLHSLSEIWRNTKQKGSLLDELKRALAEGAVWIGESEEDSSLLYFVPTMEERDLSDSEPGPWIVVTPDPTRDVIR